MSIEKVLKSYLPMTETAFYILLSLSEPRHGYAIIKYVDALTDGRIQLSSGTVYSTILKMQNDGVITVYSDSARKIVYEISPIGLELIKKEIQRIAKIYHDAKSQEVLFDE
jgi:DNA-binding PadR family transcriptional regulator